MKIFHQIRHGFLLLTSVSGVNKIQIAVYLIVNLINKILNVPVSRKELNLKFKNLNVSVQTFSSQLGSYVDIFHKHVYDGIPTFIGKPGQTIIDAGANVGFYSLFMAEKVGVEGKIYAFEPNPEVYQLLEKNIQRNRFVWIQCYQEALFSRKGMLALNADSRLSSTTKVFEFNHCSSSKDQQVKAITLDDFVRANEIKQIDILKMDTEGSEAEIAKGGLEVALPITKRVVMESHKTRTQVNDLLRPLGFRMVLDDLRNHVVYFEKI